MSHHTHFMSSLFNLMSHDIHFMSSLVNFMSPCKPILTQITEPGRRILIV